MPAGLRLSAAKVRTLRLQGQWGDLPSRAPRVIGIAFCALAWGQQKPQTFAALIGAAPNTEI